MARGRDWGLGIGGWGQGKPNRKSEIENRQPQCARRSSRYKTLGQVRRHFAEDLGDGLIYREAFTTPAADAVVEHLVEDCGLTAAVGAKRPGADLKVGATQPLTRPPPSATLSPGRGKTFFFWRAARAAAGKGRGHSRTCLLLAGVGPNSA